VDSMIKTLMKRLLLMSVCSVGLMILVAREFAHGHLSPRELGITLLILSIAIGTWGVLISKKTAKEYRVTPGPPGTAIDPVTRKRRLLGIRVGQVVIVILALSLLNGLRLIGQAPVLPLLTGVVVNLCIIGVVIRVVVKLQRSLS